MGTEIKWSVESIQEAAENLGEQNPRGSLLDQMLDALTDFSMAPHYEKTQIGAVLRQLGYTSKLIHLDGSKTLRWFKAPEQGTSFLSGAMLQSLSTHDALGVSPFTGRETVRKPLRLPESKWEKIADIHTELQRLHPEKRVSLHSTVETLLEFALQNAVTQS